MMLNTNRVSAFRVVTISPMSGNQRQWRWLTLADRWPDCSCHAEWQTPRKTMFGESTLYDGASQRVL